MENARILEINHLFVELPAQRDDKSTLILSNINLHLMQGECIGIIGGSGSGKSVLMSAIINSLRDPLIVRQGEIMLRNDNLLAMQEQELRNKILGKRIASICPNPHWRLDPIDTIGEQIKNIYASHFKVTPQLARQHALDFLKLVGIPDPEKRYNAYPNELSGGMAQRVLITIALICEPELLLADEPTGGLDVTIQIQVFNLIRKLISEQQRSTIIASRDIGLIYHLCDRIYVLADGHIVESGNIRDVIHAPKHPYTANLVRLCESNHYLRQDKSYHEAVEHDKKAYKQLLKDHINNVTDGYISLGNGHLVEV